MNIGKTAGLIVLMLAMLPVSVFSADPTKARIITSDQRITQCISSMHIRQVDGKERQLPALGFDLKPGIHTLQGTAKLNLTFCPVLREMHKTNVPPLQALFEAGKTYYIGLDHSSKSREDWRIVVWKVEGTEG